MKKIIITLLCLTMAVTGIFASNIASLLPELSESEIASLKEGQMIQRLTTYGQSIASIAPERSFGKEQAKQSEKATGDGFAVAMIKFIPYPENMKNLSEEERLVQLFNIARSVSTQKGITYISHTAGDKEITLIEDTYIISNPAKKNSRIEDPVSDKVLPDFKCYAYQKDNRFGSNVYEINYKTNDTEIYMDISNYTPMRYMGITCMLAGNLHMHLDVVQTDEGLLLYSMAQAFDRKPQVKVTFLTVDLPSAFQRRITALGTWFENRLDD